MADRDRTQGPVTTTQQPRYGGATGGPKSLLPQKGPSTAQVLAIITLLPVGGTLLFLAGVTLVGSLIGLAVATPVFLLFSPVLVPAALLVAGTVAAFLTSGAFGLTGLSSLSWVLNSFRRVTGGQDPLEYAKRRAAEGTMVVGDKTKQAGEAIKSRAGEVGGGREGATAGGGGGRT